MGLYLCCVCVDYSDFLEQTLRSLLENTKSLTVLTSPNDMGTIALLESSTINTVISDDWWIDGSKFNKAIVINKWLDEVENMIKNDDWIGVVDADIFLPHGYSKQLNNLNPKCLYSSRRRMCYEFGDWNRFKEGKLFLDDFPLYVPPVENGMVWGHRPTSNPAAISGYIQIWNPKQSLGSKRFHSKPTAAEYDVEFALSFGCKNRYFLDIDVLHLGHPKMNWEGRVTQVWS